MGEIINEENKHIPKVNLEPYFYIGEPFYSNCDQCGTLNRLLPEDLILKHKRDRDGYDYNRDYFYPTYKCLNPRCKSITSGSYSYKHNGKNILPDYYSPSSPRNNDYYYRYLMEIDIRLLPDYIRFKTSLESEVEHHREEVLSYMGLFGHTNKSLAAQREMKEPQRILNEFNSKYPIHSITTELSDIQKKYILQEKKELEQLLLNCKNEEKRKEYERTIELLKELWTNDERKAEEIKKLREKSYNRHNPEFNQQKNTETIQFNEEESLTRKLIRYFNIHF